MAIAFFQEHNVCQDMFEIETLMPRTYTSLDTSVFCVMGGLSLVR